MTQAGPHQFPPCSATKGPCYVKPREGDGSVEPSGAHPGLHVGWALTLPSTSSGSLEFMSTGLTLSPESRPLTGRRLSKMPSNLAFSSTWREH